MSPALFEALDASLSAGGPAKAIDDLCASLRESGQYKPLFYALLMKKRHALGLTPLPTGPTQEVGGDVYAAYEEGIRAAAREVGGLYLKDGNIPDAWVFYRMIEEPSPIREALESTSVGEDDDVQPLIQVAFNEGVHPVKGFEWILTRYGVCSAITTVGGGELPFPDDVKHSLVKSLIRTLHADLTARLAAEVEAKTGGKPTGSLAETSAANPWLFEEDAYHIDTSHLHSVVQMSMILPPCPELALARDLCAYGAKLTGRFLGEDDPPFEEGYADYGVYLGVLNREDVEAGMAHFRKKAESADPDEVGTYPAEVYVNLLLKFDRLDEAIAVSRKYLAPAEATGRQLTCPTLNDLCQRRKDFATLAEVAREQGDAVQFLAARIAAG